MVTYKYRNGEQNNKLNYISWLEVIRRVLI